MFYTTQAVLLTKDLSFSKHSAVISAFGREFVKTGVFTSQLHHYITSAFETRQDGDYGPLDSVSDEKAKELIEQAEEIIKIIEEYLKNEGIEL